MTGRDFMMSVTVVVSIMAVLAAIEAGLPLFPRTRKYQGRQAANLGLMVVGFGVNWVLTSLAGVLALTQGSGLMTRLGLPMFVQFMVSLVVLDLFYGYFAHVTLHAIPWLWNAHRVHHSDEFVDVTTTYRTHPIETIWRFMFVMVPVWLLGVPASVFVAYRLLSAINGMLEHANVRVWTGLDAALSAFWVTPNMHKIHHSRARTETNSNYGNLFSIHDRLFRTFTPTSRALSVQYGLDDANPERTQSLPELLVMRTLILALFVLAGQTASGQQTTTVLFMCPHGAAKSVLASAYFQRAARERGLNVHVDAVGTEPQDDVSPVVARHLRDRGYAVPIAKPRAVTAHDLDAADVVISLGCDVSALKVRPGTLRSWDDVPPPSEGLAAADEAIRRRVLTLVEELLAQRK